MDTVRDLASLSDRYGYDLNHNLRYLALVKLIKHYCITEMLILGCGRGILEYIHVGYYSATEKLIKTVQSGILEPFAQAVYPYISKLASESKERASEFLKKISFSLGIGTFFVSFLIFVFSGLIVNIVLGMQYKESIVVLRILAFLPFIIGLATLYTRFFLLGFGYLKELARIIIICAVISLVSAFIFIYLFSWAQIGAAITWLITECFVLFFSCLSYRKLNNAYR